MTWHRLFVVYGLLLYGLVVWADMRGMTASQLFRAAAPRGPRPHSGGGGYYHK